MTSPLKILPKHEHTKLGNHLFKLCTCWTSFIIKHRWLYYLLNLTWGSIITFIGLILWFIQILIIFIIVLFWIVLFCSTGGFLYNLTKQQLENLYKIADCSINCYGWVLHSEVFGKNWGGLDFGLNFFTDTEPTERLKAHEFGHSFQNCLFGPFQLLLGIASSIRYWYITLYEKFRKKSYPKAYDSFWFEDAATQCGLYAIHGINNKNDSGE